MAYYDTSPEEVLKGLGSSRSGLSEGEAAQRLEQYGPNELVVAVGETPLQMLLAQFKDLMVLILIFAGIISLIFHESMEEVYEALFIFAIVLVNAAVGFYQEFKASKDVEALKGMLSQKARVMRSNELREIHARELVPGDVVLLEEGDIVPADGRLLEVASLKAAEAALTGESLPVGKRTEALSQVQVNVADRINMCFMGTVVSHGRGRMVVTETGMSSQFGNIASLTQSVHEEASPLQRELDEVAKFIGKVVLGVCVLILLLNALRREPFLQSVIFAVAVAVAAVPEGLPAIMTITLARGVRKMVKVNTVIRKLTSVETLGSTTVICSDKTGTLTRNEMTCQQLYVDGKGLRVTGVGYSPEGKIDGDAEELGLMVRIATLCNNAQLRQGEKGWGIIGDPTEGALIVLGRKAGLSREALEKEYPRLAELPFDSERKLMSTIHEVGGRRLLYLKGAPDAVLARSVSVRELGRVRTLSPKDLDRLRHANQEMAEGALRVLACAYRELPGRTDLKEQPSAEQLEKDLVFVGLVGMMDPPRDGVKEAVAQCKRAGIRIFIITGDHGITARAIAKQLGIADDATPVVEGSHLDELTDNELGRLLTGNVIFARTLPKHKLRVVSVLKAEGEVVAVTGDGVNDAPALKEANIGVAMGITGTDVSREASDMVLTDDSFASIVNAVREGRTIYENIRKFVRYIISCNVGEVVAIVGGILLGVAPVSAVQILWVNLVTDMFPALALGVEPAEPDIMERPPKSKKSRIINGADVRVWLATGLIIGVGVLGVFFYSLSRSGFTLGMGHAEAEQLPGFARATTLAFTILVMYQVVNAFNCRSYRRSGLSQLLSNPSLLGALALSVVLQVLVVQVAFAERVLHTVPLSWAEWLVIIAVSLTVFLAEELRKRSAASAAL
ncbi:cation-translocating P-type ATPase [Candidatus Woesearchaeota archaeon]|nr:cation-translocating P-type ATPase [Candidatus Woesearchaeota archaeon]